jgi:hypothetical protein
MEVIMCSTVVRKIILMLAVLSLCLVAPSAFAEDAQSKMKQDKTGTNPINFQRELRIYDEYTWLNTAGDGTKNDVTLEYRQPLFGAKWQFRLRARHTALAADFNNDGVDDVDESGFGDTDIRFLTVPILNMENKSAWAFGLEAFFDTASEDALGSGVTALGPQAFYVKFFKQGLFAPALQYKFSIDEDTGRSEVEQFLIDLNYLYMAADKKSWFFADPQIIIDREADVEYGIVDLEFGWMMSNWTDLQGQSIYVRPSVGFGDDKATEGSVEIGYRIVGF